MSKHPRVAAIVGVMVMGSMAMAAEQVKAARGTKLDVGGTRVDIEPGASVSLRAPGTEVRTRADMPLAPGEYGTVEVRDGRIRLTGTGQTQTVTCGDDGAEVLVAGTSNQYTLQGNCKYIQVSGVSNRVWVETVGRVDVTGSGNLILWQLEEQGTGVPR